MRFPAPLERGLLLRRYKRFFADVRLGDGQTVTAHVPNPGAMLGLTAEGTNVLLSRSDNPRRALNRTLEMVETPTGLVGVNTMTPNRLVAEGLKDGAFSELDGYGSVRPEVRCDGDSRIDFLLEGPGRPPAWLEVKNCHFLRTAALAEFPDCVTARGVKHLEALTRRVQAGERAVMLFVIQRMDIRAFTTADDIDAAYGSALRRAARSGVEVLCYNCHLRPDEIRLGARVAWLGEEPAKGTG